MYIPFQQVFAGTLLSMGLLKSSISSGQVVDYCEKKCLTDNGDQACTVPFLVKKCKRAFVTLLVWFQRHEV